MTTSNGNTEVAGAGAAALMVKFFVGVVFAVVGKAVHGRSVREARRTSGVMAVVVVRVLVVGGGAIGAIAVSSVPIQLD